MWVGGVGEYKLLMLLQRDWGVVGDGVLTSAREQRKETSCDRLSITLSNNINVAVCAEEIVQEHGCLQRRKWDIYQNSIYFLTKRDIIYYI